MRTHFRLHFNAFRPKNEQKSTHALKLLYVRYLPSRWLCCHFSPETSHHHSVEQQSRL